MKKLVDEKQDKMTSEELGNAFYIWGTALSRIASKNNDVTLAEAAVDKFEEACKELGEQEMGAVGMSLYASTAMIVATEKQARKSVYQALEIFEAAVRMDKENSFESNFQYAKALKEASELIEFLDSNADETKQESTIDSAQQLKQKVFPISFICTIFIFTNIFYRH